MRTIILAAVIAVSTLTGCAGLSERDQRIGSGAVIGGIAGSVLGGSTGAAIGAIGGAVIGSEVDRNRTDKRYEDQRRRYDECRRYNSRRECDERRY